MRARTFWPGRAQRAVVGALVLLLTVAIAPPVLADEVVPTQAYSAFEAQFLVDAAHGFTFMASRDRFIYQQPGVRHLEVFDADGTSLATFEGGANGMALTATRLFVSSMGSATIRRFDVTQPVPTELTPLTIESIFPNSLVMAGGTLWMAECFPTNPSVFTIDPQTGAQAAVSIGQLDLSNCAEFTDHPTNADVVYAWSKRGGNLYRIDVSGGTFTSTATWNAPGGAAITDVAISADGATLIASVMNGSPNAGGVVLNPTTLAATGVRYDEGHNLRAVAIASDGHVATSGGASVRVFPSGVTTPNAQWTTDPDCTGGENTYRGLAFGPSPTELFVATEGQTVHLFSNPTSTLASSSVTASVTPETPFVDETYTVQGTLNVPGASSSGRTITVRVGGTVVGTTTTGAGGTYSLPITSTVSHQTCVDVRFAGTASVTGAMAADGVQVLQVPTTLVFDQPTDQLPNAEVELTGSLAFDDAASTAGSSVLVERYEDGPWVPVDTATVAGDGTWSVQTTLGAASETFRATYDGTARYAADTESVGVNVGQHVTSLTFRVTKDRVTYARPTTLRATVDLAPDTTERTVFFMSQRYGKPAKVVGKVEADADGTASLRIEPEMSARYWAEYHGDERNTAGTSAERQITVSFAIAGRLLGHHGKQGDSYLYRRGERVRMVVAIAPAKAMKIGFTLQRFKNGHWSVWADGAFPTGDDGVVGAYVDPSILRGATRYRIQASVPHDSFRAGAKTGWFNIRIT